MIRYAVTEKELQAEIEKQAPGWLSRAKRNPSNGIWNKVRAVYVRLQHQKCAYCERLLSDQEKVPAGHGRPVDHFRPKSLYPLLAHEPLNYAASCVDCNSALKKFQFPIEAPSRLKAHTDLRKLKQEKPLLIYPIGDVDDDPESLITFVGYTATAVFQSGYRHRRARKTLELFRAGPVETVTRRELLVERAQQICLIWQNRRSPRKFLRYLEPERPHANCCRSFIKLLRSDPTQAREIYQYADEFLHPKAVR